VLTNVLTNEPNVLMHVFCLPQAGTLSRWWWWTRAQASAGASAVTGELSSRQLPYCFNSVRTNTACFTAQIAV
jgi:hypothetical protein